MTPRGRGREPWLELRLSRRSLGIRLGALDWTKTVPLDGRQTRPRPAPPSATPAFTAPPVEVDPEQTELQPLDEATTDVHRPQLDAEPPAAPAEVEKDRVDPPALPEAAPAEPAPPLAEETAPGRSVAAELLARRGTLVAAVLVAFGVGMFGASQLLPADSGDGAQASARPGLAAQRPVLENRPRPKKARPPRPKVKRPAESSSAQNAPTPAPDAAPAPAPAQAQAPQPAESSPTPVSAQPAPRPLSWRPVAKARFYWFQLYKIGASGADAIYEAYPAQPRLTLSARQVRAPGRYRWIAWPQFGTRADLDYGGDARSGSFRVARAPAADTP